MNIVVEPYWPSIFKNRDVSILPKEEVLAEQLVAWGNIYMGYEPPEGCDFYDIMDAASKITGAFTGTECSALADRILEQRKRNEKTT